MPPKAKYNALDDVLELIPLQVTGEVRRRLLKLTRELDKLMALDASGEVIVDRKTARRLAKDNDFFPPDLQDRIQKEMEGHVGGKLKDRVGGRPLKWRELAAYDTPIRPTPLAELRQLGIDATSSPKDIRKAIRANYGDIPEFWLDADAAQIRDAALKGLQHNRTVWDCVVSKLGWWAALAVFAVAGAFLIVGTATGPFGLSLAVWLISVLGGGTASIVYRCVLDPNA